MSDLQLTTITSGYNTGKINNNFTDVQDVLNKSTLHSKDGKNIMRQVLDMNNYDIINVNNIYADNVSGTTITGSDVNGTVNVVVPKYWEITGDGTSTDFFLEGADVLTPLLYDVVLNTDMQEPYDDFTIVGDADIGYSVRFTSPPGNAVEGWVVLRGYAVPYNGGEPITTVSPTIQSTNTNTTVNNAFKNSILKVNSSSPVTITITLNTGDVTDWKDGDFFSIIQMGTGQVTVEVATGGQLLTLPGFEAKTRGQYSVISCSCLYVDSGQWVVTGDLKATTSVPDVQYFLLPCSDENTTDLAVANGVYTFRMPYGLMVSEVKGSLNTAQATGVALTFDVKKNGVSIFSTLPTFDNLEKTTATATIPSVLAGTGNNILGEDDEVSVDITQVGTAAAKGLKVYIIGNRV